MIEAKIVRGVSSGSNVERKRKKKNWMDLEIKQFHSKLNITCFIHDPELGNWCFFQLRSSITSYKQSLMHPTPLR